MAVFRGPALFERRGLWPRLIGQRLGRAVHALREMSDEAVVTLANKHDIRLFLHAYAFMVPELHREAMDLVRTPLPLRTRGPLRGLSPGDEIVVRVPFSGDADLFHVWPQFSARPVLPRAQIKASCLVFELTLLQSSGERLEPLLQKQWEQVGFFLMALRHDLTIFGEELNRRLLALVALRGRLGSVAFGEACRSLLGDHPDQACTQGGQGSGA